MAHSTHSPPTSISNEPFMSQMNPIDDDDASWGSVDAVDDLISELSEPTKDKGSVHNFSFDCIIDPLYELDNDDADGGEDPTTVGWQSMFSPEAEIPDIAATVSQGSSFDHEGGRLADDDIETMMTGNLLDVQMPDTIDLTEDTQNNRAGHKKKRSMDTTTTPTKIPTDHPKIMQAARLPMDESIHRIMMFLHYHEPDRHLVARAEGIVHNCTTKHYKQGRSNDPRATKELSGKIFEGLVNLLGGDRFNAVYRGAMSFAPPPPPPHHQHYYSIHEMQPQYVDPRQQEVVSLELAIAYGMHVAGMHHQSSHGSKTSGAVVSEQVQHAVHSLHTMTESERQMFWHYAVAKQEGK